MSRIILAVILIAMPMFVQAEPPNCFTGTAGNYCRYSGEVRQIYVNADNLILLYFDAPADVSMANGFGMGVAKGSAAAFLIDENPQFANYLYLTALEAQSSGRNVLLQMSGEQNGYLKIDRIWLNRPRN